MTAQVHKITPQTKESFTKEGAHPVSRTQGGLSSIVETHLKEYFDAHKGTPLPSGLYDIIIGEIERPLLLTTLQMVKGNQKKAADILGINRNTLKRKLDQHGILPCGA